MENLSFFDGIKMDIAKYVASKDGFTYLPWATAIALAGYPRQDSAMFGSQPYLEIFGGAVVAVDMKEGQRTWLPVLDNRNAPIHADNISSRDVSDAIMRCRAKAIAMTTGVGMSLYAGYDGNAEKFVDELGLTPDSDLAKAHAVTSKKGGSSGAAYLDWASALAAVMLTDSGFRWEVVSYPTVNRETGEIADMPYLHVVDTFMVAVKVAYKGREHVEILPIMGVLPVQTKKGVKKMDHQSLINPNIFDWNSSVMRCLAKAISVVSGYGLSIYAKEDLSKLGEEPASGEDAKSKTPPDLTEVRKLLKEANKDEAAMCTWLGVKTLEDADQDAITKAEATLLKVLGRSAPTPPKAPAPAKQEVDEAWPV